MNKTLKSLTRDLKNLNKEIGKFNLRKKEVCKNYFLFASKETNDKLKKILVDRASTIVNFYENVFVPKYSEINEDKIKEVGLFLQDYHCLAKKYINDEDYFTLIKLFQEKIGHSIEENNLENLIKNLE